MAKSNIVKIKRQTAVFTLNKLRLILFARKITQEELGAMADMSSGTVNNVIRRLETGDICEKFMKRNIRLVAFVIGLTPEQITGEIVVKL